MNEIEGMFSKIMMKRCILLFRNTEYDFYKWNYQNAALTAHREFVEISRFLFLFPEIYYIIYINGKTLSTHSIYKNVVCMLIKFTKEN